MIDKYDWFGAAIIGSVQALGIAWVLVGSQLVIPDYFGILFVILAAGETLFSLVLIGSFEWMLSKLDEMKSKEKMEAMS